MKRIFGVLFTLVCFPLFGEIGRGNLVVVLTNHLHDPVDQVKVELLPAAQTTVLQTLLSNSSGTAEFSSLPAGTYSVRISKPGFRANIATTTTQVTSNTTRNLKLFIYPSAIWIPGRWNFSTTSISPAGVSSTTGSIIVRPRNPGDENYYGFPFKVSGTWTANAPYGGCTRTFTANMDQRGVYGFQILHDIGANTVVWTDWINYVSAMTFKLSSVGVNRNAFQAFESNTWYNQYDYDVGQKENVTSYFYKTGGF